MKIRNWTLAIALFFVLNMILEVGCSPIISQKTLTQNTEISAANANNLIAKNIGNQNFVILDVRPADYYTSRHIAGAIDISYESANFKTDIVKLAKKKQFLVYCATGVNGAAVTQMMLGLGFKNVQNISGGYAAWVQEGFITCGCPGTVIN
jgi:rhodanese-related sulfurtransferase